MDFSKQSRDPKAGCQALCSPDQRGPCGVGVGQPPEQHSPSELPEHSALLQLRAVHGRALLGLHLNCFTETLAYLGVSKTIRQP